MLTEAALVAWAGGDLPRVGEIGRRLAGLPATDDGPVSTRLVLGLGSFLRGDAAGASAQLREAAALAPAAADPRAVMVAAAGAMFLGEDATAIDLFTAAVTRARAAGAAAALPILLAPLASLEAWAGRYASAAGNATEGLRIAVDTGQENPAAHHRGVLAWLDAVHGRERDCRAHADAALARAIGHRLGPHAGIATWALALLDLGAGRPDEARDRLAALAEAGPGDSHPVIGIFSAADLVEVAARTGRDELAGQALRRLDAWLAGGGAAWGRALAARSRGLLADGDDADGHFAEALDLHARGGRPFDTARTELLYGEQLRRRRRRGEARRHLRSAHESFERLGLTGWAELAAAELRATGETARRRDPATATQLTPQEVQIVRIVSTGATNREVAAQLFLSPRTVDYHLHKVFTKLGLSSRAELIRRAADW
jgi:DNA-binding CsgD family transcriptional regulator